MSGERRKGARAFGRGGDAYLIATVLPLAILIGYGLGWLLDRLFGTGPWLSFVFGGLGVVAGFREAIRIALRVGREEDAAAGSGRGGESGTEDGGRGTGDSSHPGAPE